MTWGARSAAVALCICAVVVVGCQATPNPVQPFARVTCAGPPAFDPAVLDQPGGAERGDGAEAAALRGALAPTNTDADVALPDSGWIQVTRTGAAVKYVAQGGEGPGLAIVALTRRDGQWILDRSGRCEVLPEIRAGLELAMWRVAAGQQLGPETTEVDVLVTELGCNSGQDAEGRVLVDRVVSDERSVIVVMATAPRGGAQECPDNPETPFVLNLPEPLGERVLMDGYSLPPRDATECHRFAC
jgi:hypothetical protein